VCHLQILLTNEFGNYIPNVSFEEGKHPGHNMSNKIILKKKKPNSKRDTGGASLREHWMKTSLGGK
jgi:hypothetical protein